MSNKTEKIYEVFGPGEDGNEVVRTYGPAQAEDPKERKAKAEEFAKKNQKFGYFVKLKGSKDEEEEEEDLDEEEEEEETDEEDSEEEAEDDEESEEEEETEEIDSYDELTVPELKAELKERGIKFTFKKGDKKSKLVKLLEKDDEESEEEDSE